MMNSTFIESFCRIFIRKFRRRTRNWLKKMLKALRLVHDRSAYDMLKIRMFFSLAVVYDDMMGNVDCRCWRYTLVSWILSFEVIVIISLTPRALYIYSSFFFQFEFSTKIIFFKNVLVIILSRPTDGFYLKIVQFYWNIYIIYIYIYLYTPPFNIEHTLLNRFKIAIFDFIFYSKKGAFFTLFTFCDLLRVNHRNTTQCHSKIFSVFAFILSLCVYI